MLILIIRKRYSSSWKRSNARVRTYPTAEKMFPINFNVTEKRFCLGLHYNWANSNLFVNGKEIVKFKAKDSKIVASPLCLGNISKDWSADNMKRTGINGYIYEINVDYRNFNPSNIDSNVPVIHEYFKVKYCIVQNVSVY